MCSPWQGSGQMTPCHRAFRKHLRGLGVEREPGGEPGIGGPGAPPGSTHQEGKGWAWMCGPGCWLLLGCAFPSHRHHLQVRSWPEHLPRVGVRPGVTGGGAGGHSLPGQGLPLRVVSGEVRRQCAWGAPSPGWRCDTEGTAGGGALDRKRRATVPAVSTVKSWNSTCAVRTECPQRCGRQLHAA